METMNSNRIVAALRSAFRNARRSQRRGRAAARGVTLTEVMIVVVILGLIAAGVGAAVFPKLGEAKIKTTKTNAIAIHQAAEEWRGLNGGDTCPTVEMLVQEKAIASTSKISDGWDGKYKIICEESDTIVTSAGPDKKEGTPDDIRVPEVQAAK